MIPRRRQKTFFKDLIHFLRTRFLERSLDGDSAKNLIKEFKQGLADIAELDPGKIILTSSGRDAILLALESMGLQSGDEIIISALNLGELVPLLQRKGYIVKLAEINQEDLSINPDSFEKVATPQSKLLIITHLFGMVAKNRRLIELAKKKGMLILEDCAHTLDKIADESEETVSDALIFSFELNKPLSTYGGGALFLKNQNHAQKARFLVESSVPDTVAMLKKITFSLLEESFIRGPLFKPVIGFLSLPAVQGVFERAYRGANGQVRSRSLFLPFQAQIGLRELEAHPARNQSLMELAKKFQKVKNPSIRFFSKTSQAKNFYSFIFLVGNPGRFKKEAYRAGIDVGIGSEVIDNCSKYFSNTANPEAAAIENQIALYPLYWGLKEAEVLKLLDFLEKYRDA